MSTRAGLELSKDFPAPAAPILGRPLLLAPADRLYVTAADASFLHRFFLHLVGEAPCAQGTKRFWGRDVSSCTAADLARRGFGIGSGRSRVFQSLTFEEHLRLRLRAIRAPGSLAAAMRLARERFSALSAVSALVCGNLSGGQQQAVMLALATLGPPAVVIIEEPWMGLAPRAREEAEQVFSQLQQEHHTACLFIAQEARDERGRTPEALLDIGAQEKSLSTRSAETDHASP